MIARWLALVELFNNKSVRERAIVAFLVFAVIYGLSDLLLISPQNKNNKDLKGKLAALQKEMTQLSAQETVFAQALTNDPNAAKKKEIEQLEARVKQLDSSLEKLSVGLIQADKLPEALQAVLQSSEALVLIGMKTKEPKRLEISNLEDGAGFEEDKPQENEPTEPVEKLKQEFYASPPEVESEPVHEKIGVFKYSVALEFEGKYFDVIRYLQALEQLPWKIYWQKLDYKVTRYPTARVQIEVYTLSTEEGMLGV